MSDKRELILARLFIVLGTIPGVDACVRNRGDLPVNKRPAITLLDGDESAKESTFDRGRMGASPNIVVMSPEIYVVLADNKQSPQLIGPALNAFRAAIIKAVLTDAELQNLVGGNGEIRYEAAVTDLARGRTIDGEIGIHISFKYVINPNEL